jgi:lipoyl-dependent peroxiredoxin
VHLPRPAQPVLETSHDHPRRGQDEYVWSGRLGRRHQRWQRRHLDEERRARQKYPYGFVSRFEGKPDTNPEELIGAAHAGCFTMALSLILSEAQLTAEHMETKAEVTLDKVGDGFAITAVHLTLTAKIPGADKAKFEELAAKAKAGCPVSKLLNTKITLDATLAA